MVIFRLKGINKEKTMTEALKMTDMSQFSMNFKHCGQ